MTDLETFLSNIQKNIRSDEEVKQWEKQQEQKQFEEWQEQSGIDRSFFEARIDSNLFTPEQKKNLLEYIDEVKQGKGQFLVLLGKVGTGKTYSACAIMNTLGFGTFIDMPEMELKLNASDRFGSQKTREDLMHKWASCKLLVLDEIGRFPHKKQQEQEILFYLINKRYQNNRPTILCSNLDGVEFGNYVGEAVIDRIKSRRTRIDLDGKSKRG